MTGPRRPDAGRCMLWTARPRPGGEL